MQAHCTNIGEAGTSCRHGWCSLWSKRHNYLRHVPSCTWPSLSGEFSSKSQAKPAFPGAHLVCVKAGNWCGKKRQMQYFFPPGLRHACTVIMATGKTPCHMDSQYHCRISPVFVRRGLLASLLFQCVPFIAVVVTFSLFFFALLFVKMEDKQLCVVVSTGAPLPFFLLFCVTHLVVFTSSYFYSVGLPVSFLFFWPMFNDLRSFNVCCFVCYCCVSE